MCTLLHICNLCRFVQALRRPRALRRMQRPCVCSSPSRRQKSLQERLRASETGVCAISLCTRACARARACNRSPVRACICARACACKFPDSTPHVCVVTLSSRTTSFHGDHTLMFRTVSRLKMIFFTLLLPNEKMPSLRLLPASGIRECGLHGTRESRSSKQP